MFSRLRESGFALKIGTGALLLCTLVLVNCSRTPKFRDNNPGTPPATTPPSTTGGSSANPASGVANPNSSNSSGGGITQAETPVQAMQSKLVNPANGGSWTATCATPAEYEPSIPALAQVKNISVTLTFGSDGTFRRWVRIYQDTDGNCQSTPVNTLSDSGKYTLGAFATNNGMSLTLSPNSGTNEYAIINIDANLEISSPIETDPTQVQGASRTVTFVTLTPSTATTASSS